jgi:hypothetical protein
MGRRAAIGVDDDLAAGQAAIAVRPADDEAAGRVDVPHGLGVDPALGQHAAHDRLDDLAHIGRVIVGSSAGWRRRWRSTRTGLPFS